MMEDSTVASAVVSAATARALWEQWSPETRLLVAQLMALELGCRGDAAPGVPDAYPVVFVAPADTRVVAPLLTTRLAEPLTGPDVHALYVRDLRALGVPLAPDWVGYLATPRLYGMVLALLAGVAQDGMVVVAQAWARSVLLQRFPMPLSWVREEPGE